MPASPSISIRKLNHFELTALSVEARVRIMDLSPFDNCFSLIPRSPALHETGVKRDSRRERTRPVAPNHSRLKNPRRRLDAPRFHSCRESGHACYLRSQERCRGDPEPW